MKKFRRFCLFFLIFTLLLGAALPVRSLNAAYADSCLTLDAGKCLAGNQRFLSSAKAALLYCPESDTMVYSWQPDLQLDPSGMNKIMTALLALEQGDLDAVVEVTSKALNTVEVGAMSVGLKAGEKLTLRDLLYCMMVGSANDAAAVIAEHIAINEGAFVSLMNERARQLGCTDTCFLNPTGLSMEGQYTTARDLAKITAAALKMEAFVELFSAAEYTVPATELSEERQLKTTNYMLSNAGNRDYLDTRVTGGKTGALSAKDRSLISTAEKDGLRYLCIVMSAQSTLSSSGTSVTKFGNFVETKALLDHGFSNYSSRQLLTADMVLEQFPVSGGENDLTVTTDASFVTLMPNEMDSQKLVYKCTLDSTLYAPIAKGDVVGTVELWYDTTCVAQGDLSALHAVREAGTVRTYLAPQANPSVRVWKRVLSVTAIVLVSILVLAVMLLVGLRFVNIYKMRKHKARRSMPRRRR